VGDHADEEDGGEETMCAQKEQVEASADLRDGTKTKETDSTLCTKEQNAKI
jgi:hypothetical protein